MSNIIKENQEALNEVPPLKINIAPVGGAPAAIKIEPDTLEPTTNAPPPIPIKVPEPLQTTIPQQQQSVEAPLPNVPYTAPPTGAEALSFGETVSRLSAQSSQEIQKILSESGQPKPNEVQKKLLGSNNPVQIDPKLTSQSNPFITGNQPRNAAERLAFEPPVLPNGLRNAFSDPNARAAIAAGISKEEYIAWARQTKNEQFGNIRKTSDGYLDEYGQVQGAVYADRGDWTGLSKEEIRKRMADASVGYGLRLGFNQNFLPFLGEDRGALETLFGVLSLPANVAKGVALDLTRPVAAVVSGGFNVDEIKKAYEAMRPTRGGTFFGAAALGENFASMDVVDGKQFNPFAIVRDDKNIPQALAGFGLDVLLDPLNIPAVESRLFGLFRRNTVTPPPITPEVLPPVRELPPSRVAGALPPAAQTTVTVPSVVDSPISPRTPPTPERVLVTPAPLRDRINLPDTSVQSRTTVSDNVGDITRTQSPSEVIITRGGDTTSVQDRTSFQVQTEDITNVQNNALPEYKRAEPELAASYESLARYEPSEVVFPVPREPYVPTGAIVKVEPADVQLYNNVTALFNDSPELPVAQNLLRAVVEQAPIPQAVYQNRILQEVAEYGRTGELTPNIAVLKGATPDEVRAIVQDRLEVLRDTPFVVPRLEVQPIEVPKLEFDITRQVPNKPSIVESSVARISPEVLNKSGGITPNPSTLVELDAIVDNTGVVVDNTKIESLAKSIVESGGVARPVILRQINPVKFEVVGDNTSYLAAKRAAELDPKNIYEVRSVIVKPDSELERLYVRQQQAYKEISKYQVDAVLPDSSTNTKTFRADRAGEGKRPYSIDLSGVTTSRGGAYNKEAVEVLAREMLESGQNIRPIVMRRTGAETAEVIRGNLEFLAAKRAQELDPRFESINAYLLDGVDLDNFLKQLDILDDTLPVPTSKPVVVTDSAIASVADLQDAAKGIGTLGEVTQWSVRGDFVTPLKDVLNAVDDLGLDVLNTPELSRMVKGGIGKLSNRVVGAVASSLQKVSLETAEDIAKSIFDALWRKSTPYQKEIILDKISTTRLEQLGLERVQTKITPPTLPTLQHVIAFHGAAKPITKLNDNYYSVKNLYGNGFYTTANADVANFYRGKNVTDESQGVLYGVTELKPQKLYDLDAKIDINSPEGAAIKSALEDIVGGSNLNLSKKASKALDDLSSGDVTLASVYNYFRRMSMSSDDKHITKAVDSFRNGFEKLGYTGYTHEGGNLISKSNVKHQVNIYWKTEDAIQLTQLDPPAPLQYSPELERVLSRYVNGEAFGWAARARSGEGLSAYPPELLRAFSENSRQYPILYRGLGDTGSVVSKVGDIVSDKAIQSFSTDLKEAATYSNGNVILKLEGADGLKTTTESANSLQTEVLVLPDSYSVKSITDVRVGGVGGGTFRIAEVVPTTKKTTPAATKPDVTDSYHVVNDSQVPIEQLRVAMLREQGFDYRTASSMKVHPLSRSMSEFGEVYDEDLIPFLKSRELSVSTPTEQKWSSKMLQQIWEVATPEQKAYIMSNVDNLEQLGLERIARSNVIDDHLPPEGVFDTPC